MKYYVRVGSQNQGPLTIDELRTRGVEPTEYVWREGLADWQPAGGVPELAGVLRKSAATAPIYAGDAASPYAPPRSSFYPEAPLPQFPSGPLKQSGFGIASTVLGVGTFAGIFIGLMVIGSMQQAGKLDPQAPNATMIGLSLSICFGGPLFQLLGLVLGIVGIFQHDRSKLFGIMGTVINGLALLGLAGIMALGMLIASTGGAG